MVIDFHYHFFPGPISEHGLLATARRQAAYYGSEGRAGVPVNEHQIIERLRDITAPDPDGSRILGRMDAAGIDVTVLLVVDHFEDPADYAAILADNKACADWAKQHPRRLISFAGMDPRRKDAPNLFRRCVEDYGMKGLKLHPDIGFYPNDPATYPLLAMAQELGMPVLIHSGPLPPTRHAKFAHPSLLDDVCLDFPQLNVVAAHMGRNWWTDWAGLAQYRHNLFGDLAMWQYAAVRDYPRFCRILREIIDWCGIEAVIFGTDSPHIEALVPNGDFVRAIRDLSSKAPPGIVFTQAEVEAILSGNARKVLGL